MADRNDPISAALARAQQLDARPWNIFQCDEELSSLALPGGEPIKSIAMVELSPDELRNVIKTYQDDTSKAGMTQVAFALRCINCDEMGGGGKMVSVADGSADKVVATMHPRVFDMALTAYRSLHGNAEEQKLLFLKTRKVVVRS